MCVCTSTCVEVATICNGIILHASIYEAVKFVLWAIVYVTVLTVYRGRGGWMN